jgi:hypothetical protein
VTASPSLLASKSPGVLPCPPESRQLKKIIAYKPWHGYIERTIAGFWVFHLAEGVLKDRSPLALLRKLPAGICTLVLLLGALLTAPGCSSKGPPPPEGQLAIEDVAKWYQVYREFNGRKAPPNEQAFIAFIEGEWRKRGTQADIQALLTSPRDGQKYVVMYGKPAPKNPERSVAVHEKEGYGGKKLVAFELGYSQEADETELQQFLALK